MIPVLLKWPYLKGCADEFAGDKIMNYTYLIYQHIELIYKSDLKEISLKMNLYKFFKLMQNSAFSREKTGPIIKVGSPQRSELTEDKLNWVAQKMNDITLHRQEWLYNSSMVVKSQDSSEFSYGHGENMTR